MKKLKTLICFAVFAVAMLLSVWAITPLTAYAIDQDYNITIADKDGSTTVGVDITTENYEDVLGDGTVSYDPTTNTLTLNNYVYNGEGLGGNGVPCAITADTPIEGLTIVLVGTNSITVSGGGSAGMAFFGGGGLTVKGNGSLVINAGAYGIVLVESSDGINIDGGNIHITTTEAMSAGIMALDFVMTSGDLKITASTVGIGTSKEDGICINGGSVEIGTAVGGYSFIYMDTDLNPVKPDTSNYVGDYNLTAGVNTNGSDASEFNEGYLSSYKYVKIEPLHVHDHGTAWESDANEHWNECECGDKANKAAHSGGTATCTEKAVCSVCNAAYGNTAAHSHGSEWKTDANEHWNECACGDKANKAAHTDSNNDGKCDTCEYQMTNGGGNTETPDNPDNPNNTLDNPNNTPDDPSDDKDGLGAGAIVGIVVGVLAVLGGGGFALYWFVLRKKPILPTDPTTPIEEAPDTDVDADTDEDAEATDEDNSPETDDEAPDTEDAPDADDEAPDTEDAPDADDEAPDTEDTPETEDKKDTE